MKRKLLIAVIIMLIPAFSGSCVKDLLPDKVTNEIKVSCSLLNYIDASLTKDIYVNAIITSGCVERKFNFIGHCWNFNTDTLPTIISLSKKVSYADVNRTPLRSTENGTTLYHISEVTTDIPVLITYNKLIVRSFIIFNDTLVRYSEPLIVLNPYDYAN